MLLRRSVIGVKFRAQGKRREKERGEMEGKGDSYQYKGRREVETMRMSITNRMDGGKGVKFLGKSSIIERTFNYCDHLPEESEVWKGVVSTLEEKGMGKKGWGVKGRK